MGRGREKRASAGNRKTGAALPVVSPKPLKAPCTPAAADGTSSQEAGRSQDGSRGPASCSPLEGSTAAVEGATAAVEGSTAVAEGATAAQEGSTAAGSLLASGVAAVEGSPVLAATAAAAAGPAAQEAAADEAPVGTGGLLVAEAWCATHTDSGRACKPPQAYVPSAPMSRQPDLAKQVRSCVMPWVHLVVHLCTCAPHRRGGCCEHP